MLIPQEFSYTHVTFGIFFKHRVLIVSTHVCAAAGQSSEKTVGAAATW